MIDTDKYEGHTPAPWDELLSVGVEDQKGWDALLELGFNDEARLLIADAPLLLAEVKWLRSLIEMVSYDLACYPEHLDQNKRQLEHNIRKWKGIEENEEVW